MIQENEEDRRLKFVLPNKSLGWLWQGAAIDAWMVLPLVYQTIDFHQEVPKWDIGENRWKQFTNVHGSMLTDGKHAQSLYDDLRVPDS